MPVASAVAVAIAGMMRPAISFAFSLSTCSNRNSADTNNQFPFPKMLPTSTELPKTASR
jgi:hypothetical protein